MTEDQNCQGISSLSSLQTEIKQETKGNKYFSAREGNNFSFQTSSPYKSQFMSNIFIVKKK